MCVYIYMYRPAILTAVECIDEDESLVIFYPEAGLGEDFWKSPPGTRLNSPPPGVNSPSKPGVAEAQSC